MLRTFLCAVLALTLVAGVSLAGQKGKKGNAVQGRIKKVDAKEGTLTVTVKSKKTEATDKEFKVSDETKVVIISGDDKKELTGKTGLKNEGFKEGAAVTVVTDESDAAKVKEVRLGETKKKKKNK